MAIDVVIIDSGGANIASLRHALHRLGASAELTIDPERLQRATHVLLPGVGTAFDAMARLRASGLDQCIRQLSQPVLGICLGMQLLFESSAEAPVGEPATPCLALLPGHVLRLAPVAGHPVPHMGWNRLVVTQPDPLLEGLGNDDYLYFVHGYVAPPSPFTLATTDYGRIIPAVVRKGNFHGVQFHPERSAAAGARLLQNFLRLGSHGDLHQ
jgi:glutamine amidotransferase